MFLCINTHDFLCCCCFLISKLEAQKREGGALSSSSLHLVTQPWQRLTLAVSFGPFYFPDAFTFQGIDNMHCSFPVYPDSVCPSPPPLCPAPGARLLPYLHALSRWQPPQEATTFNLVMIVPSLWLVIRQAQSHSYAFTLWTPRWNCEQMWQSDVQDEKPFSTSSWPNQKTIYIQAKALCSYQKLLDLTHSNCAQYELLPKAWNLEYFWTSDQKNPSNVSRLQILIF